MENLYESCKNVLLPIKDKANVDINDVANRLQIINNELSINFKSYGTGNLKDLLDICIGNDYVNKYFIDSDKEGHYKILENTFIPLVTKLWIGRKKIVLKIKKLIKN